MHAPLAWWLGATRAFGLARRGRVPWPGGLPWRGGHSAGGSQRPGGSQARPWPRPCGGSGRGTDRSAVATPGSRVRRPRLRQRAGADDPSRGGERGPWLRRRRAQPSASTAGATPCMARARPPDGTSPTRASTASARPRHERSHAHGFGQTGSGPSRAHNPGEARVRLGPMAGGPVVGAQPRRASAAMGCAQPIWRQWLTAVRARGQARERAVQA